MFIFFVCGFPESRTVFHHCRVQRRQHFPPTTRNSLPEASWYHSCLFFTSHWWLISCDWLTHQLMNSWPIAKSHLECMTLHFALPHFIPFLLLDSYKFLPVWYSGPLQCGQCLPRHATHISFADSHLLCQGHHWKHETDGSQVHRPLQTPTTNLPPAKPLPLQHNLLLSPFTASLSSS